MSKTELLHRARAIREEANRAKRLARLLTQEDDQSRLLRYARELDDRADGLERDLERDAGDRPAS